MTPIVRRIGVGAPAGEVWALLATDAGRERFWCERSRESGGRIEMTFPSGVTESFEVLERSEGRLLRIRYFGGSEATFTIEPDARGCVVTLTETGVPDGHRAENESGWVSVLLALKGAAQFGVDLRNHDPSRTWDDGFADN